MRKLILHVWAVALCLPVLGQTNINVNIDHLLNGNEFTFDQVGMNNEGAEFALDRLEYYISGISVSHDGGQVQDFSDVYVLVDAGEPTEFTVGALNMSTIEAISFHIGVDEEANHQDPSILPPSNPLAPQNPSMHWGWASGYRFLAIEGVDAATDEIVQIHALGDDYYFEITIPINETVEEDDMTISLHAHVEEILNSISFSGGLIMHGETGASIAALENMRDFVFELESTTLSTNEAIAEIDFRLSPNPAVDGNFKLDFDQLEGSTFGISIADLTGKVVYSAQQISSSQQVDVSGFPTGMYLVNLISDDLTIGTRKLIIQ